MTENYQTAAQSVANAMNAVYENKQTNKKNSISGDFSSDNASYPTVKAVKNEFGTKVTSWSGVASDSNYPSEKLVKDSLDSHTQTASTITNSTAYDNILAGESTTLTLTDQAKINAAINAKIGALSGLEVIKITSDKGTASADTMNKLYIVSEDNKVNVYYTTKSGNTYSWQKLDTNIFDEFSISWNDIESKPSSFTPASHSHGQIDNSGKIGTTANLPVITGSGGTVTVGSFGNSAYSFCEGNDNRLEDNRNPLINEFDYQNEDISDLYTTGFWELPAGMFLNASIGGNVISEDNDYSLPPLTIVSQNLNGILFVIGTNESFKQICVYNDQTFIRYGYGVNPASSISWDDWEKEITYDEVQSEISAFATALAGAINPSS